MNAAQKMRLKMKEDEKIKYYWESRPNPKEGYGTWKPGNLESTVCKRVLKRQWKSILSSG